MKAIDEIKLFTIYKEIKEGIPLTDHYNEIVKEVQMKMVTENFSNENASGELKMNGDIMEFTVYQKIFIGEPRGDE